MSHYLRISTTFLDPRFHGRSDDGAPEWPPSPLRLFQAVVAANAERIGIGGDLDHALAWLETRKPPIIVAPKHEQGIPYRLSVPNNAMDIVAKAWSRGNYFGSGDANPATHRTMKSVRPVRMVGGATLHYLWPLTDALSDTQECLSPLVDAARRVVALGWGTDLVVGHADRIGSGQFSGLSGEWWFPTATNGATVLRTPTQGTLAALQSRHEAFLRRVGASGFVPVEPLSRFAVTEYRRTTDPIGRPYVVFELRHDDGSFCCYPQRKLVHIAGMVRHLAIGSMKRSPPEGVDDDWVEVYVAGHAHERSDTARHRQFSYVPLPSIGHRHADQLVRRVMIAAPVGDNRWLEHLARRIEGQRLKPERGDEFGELGPPTLVRVRRDKVAFRYTVPANRWASVTAVILPGHNDCKPDKTRKLIETALQQSGVDQQCEFEWGAFSRFSRSLSAHKYGRGKRPTGHIRPDHLQTQTAVHLTLRFNDDLKMRGPLAIGAGRHCGFGVLAGMD